MAERMRVAAIVVSWNQARHLPACLDALDAQDHPDLEVVVIDNASTDGSDEVLRVAQARPRRHPLRVVHNPTNRGFAGAVNDGLAVVDADAVLVSNVDVVAAPDLVRRAVAVLEGDPRCGTVQPKLLRLVAGTGQEGLRGRTGGVDGRSSGVDGRSGGGVGGPREPVGEQRASAALGGDGC